MTAKIILPFILSLLLGNFAMATGPVLKRTYTTHKGDTVEAIAKKFLPTHGKGYGYSLEDYINELKILNPQIKNWNQIPQREIIFLRKLTSGKPPKAAVSVAVPAPIEALQPAIKSVPIIPLPVPVSTKTAPKLFLLLTVSQGSFSETLPTGSGNLKTTQNSPISLGFSTNYLMPETLYLLSASAYWSYLLPSKLAGDFATTQDKVTPSPEIGLNIYLQTFIQKINASLYSGIDYESFSTLNTKHFVAGNNLAIYSNAMILATLGVGKTLDIFQQKTLLKFAFSQSVSSSTTGPAADTFFGQRLLFFASVRATEKLSYHLLYKRHMLKGPTTLTIDRIGLGLGYDFF